MKSSYIKIGNFALPDDQYWSIDSLPKGQFVSINGQELIREDKALSQTFFKVGDLDTNTLGMLRVSPEGNRAILVATSGEKFWIFSLSDGTIEHEFSEEGCFFFDAEWQNNQIFGITLAKVGQGSILRIYNANTNSSSTIMNNIGTASGGVTFDEVGRLYVGNGYDGTDETGTIRAFEKTDWEDALEGDLIIDFESFSRATTVANLLSGAYLGFDRYGHLHIGGGDSFSDSPDAGYCAVLFRNGLDKVSSGTIPPIDSSSPRIPDSVDGVWQRFDPDPAENITWIPLANRSSGQLILRSDASPSRHVFMLAESEQTSNAQSLKILAGLHFGEQENWPAYANYAFVGMSVELPLPNDIPASVTSFQIKLWARDIETWGGRDGHRITFGGIELSNFKDPLNQEQTDQYTENLSPSDYATAMANTNGNPSIKIEVDDLGVSTDDFLLEAYGFYAETNSSISLTENA